MINLILLFGYTFIAFIITCIFAIVRNLRDWEDYPDTLYEFLLGRNGPPALMFGLLWPVILPIFVFSLLANKIEDFGKLVVEKFKEKTKK